MWNNPPHSLELASEALREKAKFRCTTTDYKLPMSHLFNMSREDVFGLL